ncbi:MAG: hypothetical protein ABSG42_08310, partial [Nitrospirota bacterium]
LNLPTSFQSARGILTELNYDSQADLQQVTYADNHAEVFDFADQGILTQSVNGRGQTIIYTTNAKGQLTRKQFADGSTITYLYDAHRNVTNVTQVAGGQSRTTVLAYDGADRLTRVTDAAQRTVDACYRTIYARARTGLAFIRTGISFISLGLGLTIYFGISVMSFMDLALFVSGLLMTLDGVLWYLPVRKEKAGLLRCPVTA